MSKPHENTFTKLGFSKIHGVGIFAIVDIPKEQIGLMSLAVNAFPFFTNNPNRLSS